MSVCAYGLQVRERGMAEMDGWSPDGSNAVAQHASNPDSEAISCLRTTNVLRDGALSLDGRWGLSRPPEPLYPAQLAHHVHLRHLSKEDGYREKTLTCEDRPG